MIHRLKQDYYKKLDTIHAREKTAPNMDNFSWIKELKGIIYAGMWSGKQQRGQLLCPRRLYTV